MPSIEHPFADNTWNEVVTLEELRGMKIVSSVVQGDYFLVAEENHEFFMFDNIGYKLIDRGLVRNYPVNCMLALQDNMCIFGHQGGLITLWDTSKRYLKVEELQKLKESITEQETKKLDFEALIAHRVDPKKAIAGLPVLNRTDTIIANAKTSDLDDHSHKVGKRRLLHRESYLVRPHGNISSLVKCHWQRVGDSRPHFMFTNECGIYEVAVDNWRMYQNYFNEIVQDSDIKHIVHLQDDQYLAYPKWDKRVWLINMQGKYLGYSKGKTVLRDIEWTQSSLAVKDHAPVEPVKATEYETKSERMRK